MTQPEAETPARHVLLAVTGLFFLSGCAGLVYQVLWMRALGLFFGSDLYGVTIVLSTFMGGLALGSLFGGRLAERIRRPLLGYGLAEIGIGLFALGFAPLLDFMEPMLRGLYPQDAAAGSTLYTAARVAVSTGALTIPTALMGATLPLIMRHFARSQSDLGLRAAWFYAVNTLGALSGTLVAGFLLLPYFGTTTATALTAAVNLAVGIVCLPLGLRAPVADRLPRHTAPLQPDVRRAGEPERNQRLARFALVAFGISGFGSFALEVVWTRVLLISFSSTVYSFASMLACFLFGIFFGSLWIANKVDRHRDPMRLFAALELGVGVCVAALCLLVNVIPDLFAALLGAGFQFLPGDKGGALVLATLLTSFLLLVAPTSLLGATFAVALRTYTTNVARIGSRTGNLYFANTLGAIAGSISAGLVLIPMLGVRISLAAIALLFTAIGLSLFAAANGSWVAAFQRRAITFASLAVVLAVATSLVLPYRVTLNFNQRASVESTLLYHAEGVQNTIDVVRSAGDVTSLIIGGNVEADDGPTQLRHFILKGHLPLLLHDDPKSVLVVGLGMGITLAATARHAELERIDVVELSPQILEAQAVLREVNGDVTNHPIVNVRIDDGRNYMKMTQRRYDMITADPIHPKISRVGYLYTREYYESIRARLAPGGVVCQWMPIYQISPTRLRSAIKTFAEVFPGASFWYVKNHGLLIAREGDDEIDFEALARRFADPVVRADLARIDIERPEDLLALLLLGPEDIAAYVAAEADVPINTDDHPYLEYFVPGDLFRRPVENVREILRFESDPAERVRALPAGARARLRQALAGRATRLLAELEPKAN